MVPVDAAPTSPAMESPPLHDEVEQAEDGAVAADGGSSPTSAPSFVRAKEEEEEIPTELVSSHQIGIFRRMFCQ